MLIPTAVLLCTGVILFLVNYKYGERGQAREGVKNGAVQLRGILPILLVAFILAGMLEVLIPEEFIEQWLAREAGLRGVLLGSVGGGILAMGPYASFPIISSIYNAGAGVGTTVALTTGYVFLNLSLLPYEGATLGFRFSAFRLGLLFPFCLLAGGAAYLVEVLFL